MDNSGGHFKHSVSKSQVVMAIMMKHRRGSLLLVHPVQMNNNLTTAEYISITNKQNVND